MVYNWLNYARNALYPNRCRLCLAPGQNNLELCTDCLHDLPWLTHSCQRCAIPLPEHAGKICGHCLSHPFAFKRCNSLLIYQYPVDFLIQRIKFQQDFALLHSLGQLLAERLTTLKEKPDRVIPVPLHKKRLSERGYNQSLELLRPTIKLRQLNIDTRCCKRIRNTATQSMLPAKQRHKNLNGAFATADDFTDQHIVLIDDVMTTGNTLNELAKTLKSAGARSVDAWVIARTKQ